MTPTHTLAGYGHLASGLYSWTNTLSNVVHETMLLPEHANSLTWSCRSNNNYVVSSYGSTRGFNYSSNAEIDSLYLTVGPFLYEGYRVSCRFELGGSRLAKVASTAISSKVARWWRWRFYSSRNPLLPRGRGDGTGNNVGWASRGCYREGC